MKCWVILVASLTVAAGYPVVKTWTLSELSVALETKADPSMQLYQEEALNQIMLALFTGKNEKSIQAVIPSPKGETTWTVDEVTKALEDPNTRPEYRPALLQAYGYVMNNNATDEYLQVILPALDISTWTQSDLYEAIVDPFTEPELMPYLKKAQSELKRALIAGEKKDTIGMVTPVGLVPAKNNNDSTAKPLKRFFKKYNRGS